MRPRSGRMLHPVVTLFAAVALARVPLGAGRLRFLDVIPRSRWLSFGGGISVAYVFVRLLPELKAARGGSSLLHGHVLPEVLVEAHHRASVEADDVRALVVPPYVD